MNIIFIEDSSKSVFGGGQIISSFVLSALNKNESNVVYVDFANNPILKSCLPGNNNKFVRLLHKRRMGLLSQFLSLIFILPNILKLTPFLARDEKAVIYATTKRALIYAGILGLIFRRPYIYHAHMLLQNKRYDPIVLLFIKKAAVCICASAFVLEEFSRLGVINVNLLRNPIHNEVVFKIPRLDMNKMNVAFVGSVIEIKGVNYLLDILNYEVVTDTMVHIFGDGDQLSKLKECYSGQDKIVFHGFVDSIIDYMDQMIDVLVVPTIIPEAGPTIIQLGMSRGIPIITTNIGAQRTFIKDGHDGILVDPKNSFQIAKAVMSLKDSKETYNKMSFNATVSANEFDTMETFNSKLLNLVNQFD